MNDVDFHQKLAEFAAKDSDEARRELIASLRRDFPDMTQKELDVELGLIEATIGF